MDMLLRALWVLTDVVGLGNNPAAPRQGRHGDGVLDKSPRSRAKREGESGSKAWVISVFYIPL